MKYDQVVDGEWVRPIKRGYKMICCDCGLVHRVDFDHVPYGRGRRVIFRVFRDNRATGQMRRHLKKKLEQAVPTDRRTSV